MPSEKLPPGPVSRWWSGFFRQYSRDPLGYLTFLFRTYGDVVGLRYFRYRVTFISHPKDIKEVLVNLAKKFAKGRILRANKRLFGNDLLTSEGEFWLRQRRLAQPAFHRARVASYAETMVRYAERMLETWRDGEERDIHQEMTRLTLQIVAKTLFDADVENDAREVGRALQVVMDLNSNFRRLVMTPPWLPTRHNVRAFFAVRRLNKIIYRIIAERRASGRDTGDLLSMLLAAQDEDGSQMTDQQLRDEVITLFLAGHETTALTLSWAWYLLALNPEAESRFHKELETVLHGHAPTFSDLPPLKYTEMIAKAWMRLDPPAYGVGREAIEECEIGGYRVPAKTQIFAFQWVTQRDPRYFDAPDQFRPDRWTEEFTNALPKYAYFPFGGGPRACIGNSFAMMEIVLAMATMGRKFRFKISADTKVEILPAMSLRPRAGIPVAIENR